jgi:tetratricopeptide (TPR) repeat protein
MVDKGYNGRLLALLLTTLAFAAGGSEAAEGHRREAGRPSRGGPRGPEELPTTAADIYWTNVAGRVSMLEGLLVRAPDSQAARVKLSQLLHMRGKYRGDLDELQHAIELLGACVARAPGDARLYALRASQQLTLHRFAQAGEDLDRARALGASEDMLRETQQELDWSQGRYAQAEASIRRAAAERPSVWTLARLAQLEHDLGRYAEADQAFARAEDFITDTSPLSVAWLNLQRGHHELVLGENRRAEAFFREAVRRMPGYTPALEHLAETLHLQGRDTEARALYSQALGGTDDQTVPEVLSGMTAVLLSEGREEEAARISSRSIRKR